jgi:toluene monooxygenase system ferredoxin subunit
LRSAQSGYETSDNGSHDLAWQRLCSVAEVLDGRLLATEVHGVQILVTKVGDVFVAFPPLCPHMAEPLAVSGICADGVLTCTKHIWQWELKTGAPTGEAEKPLLRYPLRLEGDTLWIDFERELTYEYED